MGVHQFFFSHGGGWTLGIEAGVLFPLESNPWTDQDGNTIEGVRGPPLDGVYIKLNVGGGGFFYK